MNTPKPTPATDAAAQRFTHSDDAALVAELGGCAVEPARQALEALGGLNGLRRAGVARIAEHLPGGSARRLTCATRIAAGLELGRRAYESATPLHRVGSSDEVAALFRARLGHLDHEEMWLVALDGRNRVRATRKLSQGGLHGVSISARDVLRIALLEAASAFVLVHNHPSGDPRPSPEDIATTKAIVAAATVVGLQCVDHVIVTREAHASLLDLRLI